MDKQAGSIIEDELHDEMDLETADDTVEVAQARIEQTRTEMSGTLEAIKDKLNPQMLMQQAKETVHDVTSDLAQQAKDTVHAVTSDVVQQAKDNLPQVTASAAQHAVSGAVTEAKEAIGDAVETARNAGNTMMDIIERNPLPVALLAGGACWYWLNSRKRSDNGYASQGHGYREQQSWKSPSSGYDYPYREGEQPGIVHKAKAALGDATETAKDAVGSAMESTKHAVGSAVESAKDVAGNYAVSAREVGTQVQQRAEQTMDSFQRVQQEHPLSVGLIALGIGAAVGLAIPKTRKEQEWMGETRDRVVDKVQEAAKEVGMKAQIVAEEALNTAKEEAKTQGLAAP